MLSIIIRQRIHFIAVCHGQDDGRWRFRCIISRDDRRIDFMLLRDTPAIPTLTYLLQWLVDDTRRMTHVALSTDPFTEWCRAAGNPSHAAERYDQCVALVPQVAELMGWDEFEILLENSRA